MKSEEVNDLYLFLKYFPIWRKCIRHLITPLSLIFKLQKNLLNEKNAVDLLAVQDCTSSWADLLSYVRCIEPIDTPPQTVQILNTHSHKHTRRRGDRSPRMIIGRIVSVSLLSESTTPSNKYKIISEQLHRVRHTMHAAPSRAIH